MPQRGSGENEAIRAVPHLFATAALLFAATLCATAAGVGGNDGHGLAREVVLAGGIGGQKATMTLTQRGDSLWGTYKFDDETISYEVSGNMADSSNIVLNEYEAEGILAGYFKLYYGEFDGDEFIGGEYIAGHTGQTVLFHEKSSRPLPPEEKSDVRFSVPKPAADDGVTDGAQVGSGALTGQGNRAAAGDTLFENPERMPGFPGGITALMAFISSNLRYPAIAKENNVQGRVIVKFVVRKDGSVGDAVVLRGVDKSLDEEALRIVNAMPRWKPGTQKGKPVSVRYALPIMFKL